MSEDNSDQSGHERIGLNATEATDAYTNISVGVRWARVDGYSALDVSMLILRASLMAPLAI